MERAQKLIDKLQSEMQPKVDEINANDKKMKQKLQILEEKIFGTVKIKCKSYLDWMEKNSKQKQTSEGVQYELIKEENRNEFNKYASDLQSCVDNLQFGMDRFVAEIEMETKASSKAHDACFKKCLNDQKLSDDVITNCVRGCFNKAVIETQKSWENLDEKISDVLVNLRNL
jgi:hypothetical protein